MSGETAGEGGGVSGGPEEEPRVRGHRAGIGVRRGDQVHQRSHTHRSGLQPITSSEIPTVSFTTPRLFKNAILSLAERRSCTALITPGRL